MDSKWYIIVCSAVIIFIIYSFSRKDTNKDQSKPEKIASLSSEEILISYANALAKGREVRKMSDLEYSKEEIKNAFINILKTGLQSEFSAFAMDKLIVMYINLDAFLPNREAELIDALLNIQRKGVGLSDEQKSILSDYEARMGYAMIIRQQEYLAMQSEVDKSGIKTKQ